MDRVDYESVVIQDLLNFHSRQELDITPWYQRRAVWRPPQKAYLINTVFEGKPVPSIYIRHTIDLQREQSIKEVVDGQQRIRCILEYREDRFAAPHPRHQNAVRYSDLTKNERSAFLLTALSVGYLIGATDADVIEIFARINSVAKTLNPQEKRNALYSGAFKRFCLAEAIERLPFWRDYSVFTDNDIARMLEVQFISDLVMNLQHGLQDFSASKLTQYYEKFDDSYPKAANSKKRLDRVFEIVLDLKQDVLKGSIFCRPQILFSLLLVLDQVQKPQRTKIERCISDVDAAVQAVQAHDDLNAVPPSVYEAFTSGNMHRIRLRRIRDKKLMEMIA